MQHCAAIVKCRTYCRIALINFPYSPDLYYDAEIFRTNIIKEAPYPLVDIRAASAALTSHFRIRDFFQSWSSLLFPKERSYHYVGNKPKQNEPVAVVIYIIDVARSRVRYYSFVVVFWNNIIRCNWVN